MQGAAKPSTRMKAVAFFKNAIQFSCKDEELQYIVIVFLIRALTRMLKFENGMKN